MRLDHSPALPHAIIISILKNLCTNHMGAIGKGKTKATHEPHYTSEAKM